MARHRTPVEEELLRKQRRKDWETKLWNELKTVLFVHASRSHDGGVLDDVTKNEINALISEINYDKTWAENIAAINAKMAPIEGRFTNFETFEHVVAQSKIEFWLPHQFRGVFIDGKGKEEIKKVAPDVKEDYELNVNDPSVYEEWVRDDEGDIKKVYTPDRIVPADYVFKYRDEQVGSDYPDGRKRIRTLTGWWVRIYEYKPGTGFEVNNWTTYEAWRKLIDPDEPPIVFLPAPHKVGNKEIWTYDQFKLYILDTYPRDYLEIRRKGTKIYKTKVVLPDYVLSTDLKLEEQFLDTVLPDGNRIVQYVEFTSLGDDEKEETFLTHLASFVEKFLKEESLGSNKKHIIGLFKRMEYDFIKYQPIFWQKIRKFIKIPAPPTIPVALTHPDIQEMVNDLSGFITYLYSGWPDPYDLVGFMATKAAILKDYEFMLREELFRFIKNPRFFQLEGKRVTRIVDAVDSGETYNWRGDDHRKRAFQTIDEHTSMENPLKSEIAENLREYGAYKAMSVETSSRSTTTGNKDEVVGGEGRAGGKKGRRNMDRYIEKQFDPFDIKKVEWVDKLLQRFLVYTDLHEKLDRFFVFSFDIERDLGYEDEGAED
jgi:hypothetical protein